MSIDIIISLLIMALLVSTIWRLNRNTSPRQSRVINNTNRAQNKNNQKSPCTFEGSHIAASELSQGLDTRLENKNETKELVENLSAFELLVCTNITDTQRQQINQISQSFRKPHPLLLPLTQGVFEPQELFDLIKTDAEMTAKILNAVNSPLFSLRQPITNVNHAIIFLGISKIKTIALQFAMQNDLDFCDPHQNLAYRKLWSVSYLASNFCQIIAKKLGEEEVADLSTRCLLSYLGDFALLSAKPANSDYYLANKTLFARLQAIQSDLGVNSALIGKSIAKQWQLPETIEKGIEWSLHPISENIAKSPIETKEQRHMLLCYLSCRLAEMVVLNNMSDISNIDITNNDTIDNIDFYNMNTSIKNTVLEKLYQLFNNQIFIKKMNSLITKTVN